MFCDKSEIGEVYKPGFVYEKGRSFYMFSIDDADLYVILNNFYSSYFVDYFEEALSDETEEYSAVTLFRGMNYFIELCSKLNIMLPFDSIEDYIIQNYEDGHILFENVNRKYLDELNHYNNADITFREQNSIPDFI